MSNRERGIYQFWSETNVQISPRDAMVTMKGIFADCQNVLVQRSPLAMDTRARWGKEEPILGEQADLLGHLSGIDSREVPLDTDVLELLPDILIDQSIQVLNVPVQIRGWILQAVPVLLQVELQ